MAVWSAGGNRARPAVLWFHGGGFQGGDHLQIPPERPALANQLGMTFFSATYRLRDSNPTRMDIMMDGARALQYIRHHHEHLQIDPTRIAVCGGSAGGHIAGWLAYHADLADTAADDPVRRCSTRVNVVGLVNTQPVPEEFADCVRYLGVDRDLVELTVGKYLLARAEEQLQGVWFQEPFHHDDFETEAEFIREWRAFYRECSVFDQATAAAPPTFFVTQDVPPTAEQLLRDDNGEPADIDLHHPVLMLMLKNKLDSLGVQTTWSSSFDAMLRFFGDQLAV